MKKDDFLLTDDSKIIKKHLRQFYDNEAEKYYNTRQKYWKDAEYLLQEIQSTGLKKIKILEFWCGWWRFIKYLHEHFDGEIEYIGIDLSSELLKFAKKDNPNDTFICNDIFKEIINYEQESFDFIVGTSSFQHIPSYKERLFLMKHFYRILNYGGKVLMLNRTYSDRLIKKYKKYIEDLNIDFQEVYSECSVGFSDGLRNYQENKNASLATFITLCVERKLSVVIRKYNCEKYKVLQDAFSLDFIYKDSDMKLMDIISDEAYEPLKNMTDKERYDELLKKIINKLAEGIERW